MFVTLQGYDRSDLSEGKKYQQSYNNNFIDIGTPKDLNYFKKTSYKFKTIQYDKVSRKH